MPEREVLFMADSNNMTLKKNNDKEETILDERDAFDDLWTMVKPDAKMEGQSTEDYVKDTAMTTGFIGGVRGALLGFVDLISKAIGTFIRNILFNERMQMSMTNKVANMQRENKAPSKEEANGKAKENNEQENAQEEKQEEQNKEILEKKDKSFYDGVLKQFDAEITKDLSKFCFRSGEEAFVVPFDKKISAQTFFPAFWSRNGKNPVQAAADSVLLAAALTKESQSIIAPVGNAETCKIDITKNDNGNFSMYLNGKPLMANMRAEVFYNIDEISRMIGSDFSKYIEKKVEIDCCEEYKIHDCGIKLEPDGFVKVTQYDMSPQGHDGSSTPPKIVFESKLQSMEDVEKLKKSLLDNFKLTDGQAIAVTALYAPNISRHIGNENKEGAAHLTVHDKKITQNIVNDKMHMEQTEMKIPKLHSMSQNKFDKFIKNVAEAYDKTADCKNIDPDFTRESFPDYNNDNIHEYFCQLEEIKNLALEQNEEKGDKEVAPDAEVIQDYSDVPDHGRSTVSPEEFPPESWEQYQNQEPLQEPEQELTDDDISL